MSFRKVFLLGGAALLMAACNSGVTAPVARVRGGAAAASKAPADSTKKGTPPAATTNAFEECTYPVTSGFVQDSTCPQPDP